MRKFSTILILLGILLLVGDRTTAARPRRFTYLTANFLQLHRWSTLSGMYGKWLQREQPTNLGERIDLLDFERPDILNEESHTYSFSDEAKPWGQHGFLKHEVSLFRGSIGSIRDDQMQLSAIDLFLYRKPVGQNCAVYGENYLQAYTYATPRFGKEPGERTTFENRTSIGFEYVHEDKLRFRLPVFFEQKYLNRPEDKSPWNYAAWIAPQIAYAPTKDSEFLITTSTVSFINSDFSQITPANLFKPTWFEVLFRKSI